MEHSFTNRAKHWRGDTVAMTVRLPRPLADFIDSRVDGTGQIRNRSEYLQHWAQIGRLVDESSELSEALDWALTAGEPDGQAPACKAEEPGSTPGPASEPEDTVAEVITPPPVQTDELTSLRESQLEALRSRVR